ncbi:MAG: HNH/endonuclease VII fold putative polymorphic toxin [Actinomycetota bacterium]|nr:HNH/endonuclease VII fold putative polymorphic toxin [Actinomycetota bacterium]
MAVPIAIAEPTPIGELIILGTLATGAVTADVYLAEGNPPPNLSPPGAGRSGSLREAKRNNGIPVSQQPSGVRDVPDRTNPGKSVKEYDYKDPQAGKTKTIRDDRNGHRYPDDPSQNRGPHFNDPAGRPYDY